MFRKPAKELYVSVGYDNLLFFIINFLNLIINRYRPDEPLSHNELKFIAKK